MRTQKHSEITIPSSTLEHIGIAVKSIATARAVYKAFGLHVSLEETIEHEHVRIAMIEGNGSRIELLEATTPDCSIARFISQHGEGLHHIAIRTSGIDEMFKRLSSQNIRWPAHASA